MTTRPFAYNTGSTVVGTTQVGSIAVSEANVEYSADYGGLKELKAILEEQFDHTLLVAQDDPELETFKMLQDKKLAKLTILPRVGCEGLADMLYKYVNGVYIPDLWGPGEAERLWCYRVEVRETQSNMAFREGHREWNEDLFA